MASIDFDPEDYLDEVDTDDLIDELKERAERENKRAKAYLSEITKDEDFQIPIDIPRKKLKEVLCDYLQLSHCSTPDQITNQLHTSLT